MGIMPKSVPKLILKLNQINSLTSIIDNVERSVKRKKVFFSSATKVVGYIGKLGKC